MEIKGDVLNRENKSLFIGYIMVSYLYTRLIQYIDLNKEIDDRKSNMLEIENGLNVVLNIHSDRNKIYTNLPMNFLKVLVNRVIVVFFSMILRIYKNGFLQIRITMELTWINIWKEK